MQCILTGFDAFDNSSVNPSQQAVERVPDVLEIGSARVPITKIVLPTCCDLSWETLQKHVDMLSPDERFALLLSGLAHKREKITPERYALNVRDYRISDNRGHKFEEQPIDSSGAELLRTTLPLKDLLQRLNSCGFPAETSYHAGTFVCNEVYYRALHRWGSDKRCAGVLFMHFPSPENYARVFKVSEADAQLQEQEQAPAIDAIEHFGLALQETIRFMCEQFVTAAPAAPGG